MFETETAEILSLLTPVDRLNEVSPNPGETGGEEVESIETVLEISPDSIILEELPIGSEIQPSEPADSENSAGDQNSDADPLTGDGTSEEFGESQTDNFEQVEIDPSLLVDEIDLGLIEPIIFSPVDDIIVARTSLEDQIWSQDDPNILDQAEEFDRFGKVLATGDFDGDGFDDVAVGAPFEDVGNTANAGAVNIIYGSSVDGITPVDDQIWTQNSSGLNSGIGAEEGDQFGSSLATGDFNGDGYADLAIGAPREDNIDTLDGGMVNVIYGSATGLTATGSQFWTQNSPGLASGMGIEQGDQFGTSVATGDFNRDGYADLAIGVPGEDVFSISNGGAVNIIYGSASGLTAADSQIWHQNTFGDQASPVISGTAEAGDNFGESLTNGDFDGDGHDDVAVGVPNEDLGTLTNAGAVNVIYGNTGGWASEGNQFWSQNSFNVEDEAEEQDQFGSSLTSGDFDGDGHDDLAVGVPDEDIGDNTNAGGVNVLYGTSNRLNASGNQFWSQNSSGIKGESTNFDLFGFSLTAGDFDFDGYDDLAIGVTGDNVGLAGDAGVVNLIRGSEDRLTDENDQLLSQNTLNIPGESAEAGDFFGEAVAAGDFNGDNYADLAVGASLEDISPTISETVQGAGSVSIIYDA